jgi:peptidoglycan/LPS O-acetylase OafA/YrhL
MSSENKPVFLGYLHSFRGFAIINIVAVHAFVFASFMATNSFNSLSPLAITNELLFHNSTIYFAIISGMLFTAVLKKKGYKAFFLSKFKYVLLPYVFFTLAYSAFDNTSDDWLAFQPNLQAYLNELPRNFIYGKASFVFWYIPVLFFLYLVTPLLNYLMSINKWGIWIIAVIIALPLVIRRVELMGLIEGDFLSLQTMIYFTGAYAAGMFIANNLERRLEWISQNKWLFIGISLASTLALLFITLYSIDRFGFFSLNSTLYYIQKIALSGLVLILFKSLGDSQPKWLNPIAKGAFTIYFAHVFFLTITMTQLLPIVQNQRIEPFNVIIAGFLLLIISTILSIVFVWLFRKLFGKYSRMVIGS